MGPKPFKLAGPFWRFMLPKLGFHAIAMPNGRAYFLSDVYRDNRIRRHELCHLRQMKRDGKATFIVRYFCQLHRHGYWQAPYELEARASELRQQS